MNMIFAGTGSAFTMLNNQTNVLIQRSNKFLLIDAGGDIRFSLQRLNMTYSDIDSIYITHLHNDHVGGLEWFAFCSYFSPNMTEKIELIGNNELLRELWIHSLRGGLKSIQGKKMALEDYFDVLMVRKNGKFIWEDIEFRIVQTVHVMDEYSIVPSFGLMFRDPDSNLLIYYTGDTQFNPNQIMDFYKEADVIIQDCETAPYRTGVHAHFDELKDLPLPIKQKMILQHYNDNAISDSEFWEQQIHANEFMRLAKRGDIMQLSAVIEGDNPILWIQEKKS